MNLSKRKSIRLKNYDYSQNGAYFVTICTQNKECLLGEIVGQGLCSCRLSPMGHIVNQEINGIEERYSGVNVEKYIIMPNHIHIIIHIYTENRQEQSPCPTLGDVICSLKSITTKTANLQDNVKGRKVWQYRFHDHIIRNEQEYQKIWEYIDTNPLRWELDCYHIQ